MHSCARGTLSLTWVGVFRPLLDKPCIQLQNSCLSPSSAGCNRWQACACEGLYWGWSSRSAVSSPHSCCVPPPHLLAQLALGHPAQRFLATSTRCLWKTNHLKVGCLWAKPAPACCLLLRGNWGKVAGAECVRHSPAPQGTHTEHPRPGDGTCAAPEAAPQQGIPQALLGAVELASSWPRQT